MNTGYTVPSAALPEYLNPLDPSMNLYYNTRTHKLQYYYGPSIESQYEDRDVPPLEITALYEGQQAASNWQFVSSRTDDEWWKAASESEAEKGNIEARKDSANDIDIIKDNLQSYSNVCLDLRLKYNIASLSRLFTYTDSTTITFNCPKRIEIHHTVIECADIEELAEARPATTTFNTYGDGSISVACSFSLNPSIGCACRVESALAPPFGKHAVEPEHMAAKRRMWWKLSQSPRRAQERHMGTCDPDVELSSRMADPLLLLVGNFIKLLRPKLGSDPEVPMVPCGLGIFERPTCGADIPSCVIEAFHTSGIVNGMAVDMSANGRRDCERDLLGPDVDQIV